MLELILHMWHIYLIHRWLISSLVNACRGLRGREGREAPWDKISTIEKESRVRERWERDGKERERCSKCQGFGNIKGQQSLHGELRLLRAVVADICFFSFFFFHALFAFSTFALSRSRLFLRIYLNTHVKHYIYMCVCLFLISLVSATAATFFV